MFITFEGIEGCGKTTQIKRLAKILEKHGIKFIRTLEPGGTQVGKTIRKLLLDSRNKNLTPLTELILYIADRAQHIEEVIRPALDKGYWVICDRFFDATIAYQGSARGQDLEFIRILNDSVTQGLKPDLTILLDCPAETGLERAVKRNKINAQDDQDRFEREGMEFHRAVRRGYLDLAHDDKKRFVIINAMLTENEVEQQIHHVLRPYLEAI